MKLEFRNESLESNFSLIFFCQQVDDWMLLTIIEKIIQENAFEKKK